jgi:hypothetical protein
MPPKDKKKEKPAGWNFDPIEAVLVLLFLVAILGTVIPAILSYITSGQLSFFGFKLSGIIEFFKSHTQFFKALGFVTAGGAAIGTFVYTKMADTIWREEKAKLFPDKMTVSSVSNEPVKNVMTDRWQKIIKLSESDNSSDWRLAIIEADIILDELLTKLQLPGETMGEKLKAVEKSDFTTIENAWEAHKVRNMIAHESGDFLINQHEIRRVISLYESVFKEFYMI